MKFEITPVLDTSKGIYVIPNHEELVNQVKAFCEEQLKQEDIKSTRTDVRAKKKLITETRLKINKLYFGVFNDQLKEVEKLLDECDKALKEKLPPDNKPKMSYIKIGHFSKDELKKVIDFASSLGCYVKEVE